MSRPKVVRIIARLNTGGPARHVALLCDGLAAVGFESLLVYGRLGPGEGSLEDLAVSGTFRSERIPGLGRSIRPLDDCRAFLHLLRLLRRERPDIVHTHTSKAGTVGRLAACLHNLLSTANRRCAIVHTFHGHVFTGYFGRLGTTAARIIERLLARWSHVVIAISPGQAAELTRQHRIVREEKMRMIPLGLDLRALLARVAPDRSLRQRLGYSGEHIVCGFVGRLVAVKAVDVLLMAFRDAWADERKLRLLIVGDGEARTVLEAQTSALGVGDAVQFLGWQHDLAAVYGALDIVVLSSVNEGTPVALIEAAAAGLPVVATRVGGVPDVVVDRRHGYLVPPADPAAFAHAVVALARSPSDRRRMGEAARTETAGRYRHDRLLSDMAGLYQECLAMVHRHDDMAERTS